MNTSLWLLLLTFVAVLMSTSHVLAESPSGTKDAKGLIDADRVLVIGHRGSAKSYPENTLPSFQAAIDAKADLIELDYHHSADAVPVVIHDGTLDRTTDACKRWNEKQIKVSSRNLNDLRLLDTGSWKSPDFRGTSLPTLVEAIDLIQNGSITLIERKGGDAATCIKMLRAKNLVEQVVVQAFDWDYLKDAHNLAPELVLGALGDGAITNEVLKQVRDAGASVIGWSHKDVTADSVALAKQHGFRVWTYTVNEPQRAVDLVNIGVDGIITDSPDLIRRTLTKD